MIRTAVLCAVLAAPVVADPAEVVGATADLRGNGWQVSVTLRHGDTGWDDYADGWRLVTDTGTVLATRPLAHPHVNEQPFTRSLTGVTLAEGLREVWVETSTSPDGWSGPSYKLTLP